MAPARRIGPSPPHRKVMLLSELRNSCTLIAQRLLDDVEYRIDCAGLVHVSGARLAFHLEGRMRDVEAPAYRCLDALADDLGLFETGVPVENDVSRKRPDVARQAPAVKVW